LSSTQAIQRSICASGCPKKARAIIEDLMVNRGQVYKSLKRLQAKGITGATEDHPLKFSAIPFEEVLDLLLEVKKDQAKSLQASKEELIADFRNEKKKSKIGN
jgi:sugar-specific transcriptional regulator TrmB